MLLRTSNNISADIFNEAPHIATNVNINEKQWAKFCFHIIISRRVEEWKVYQYNTSYDMLFIVVTLFWAIFSDAIRIASSSTKHVEYFQAIESSLQIVEKPTLLF